MAEPADRQGIESHRFEQHRPLELALAVWGGTIIERVHPKGQLEEDVHSDAEFLQEGLRTNECIQYAWERVRWTVRKVFPYVLAGLFVAVCIIGIIFVGYVFNAMQGFIL